MKQEFRCGLSKGWICPALDSRKWVMKRASLSIIASFTMIMICELYSGHEAIKGSKQIEYVEPSASFQAPCGREPIKRRQRQSELIPSTRLDSSAF
jgi:hypothetical protein